MSSFMSDKTSDFDYQHLFDNIVHISQGHNVTTTSLAGMKSRLDEFKSSVPAIEALLPVMRHLLQHLDEIWHSKVPHEDYLSDIIRVLADATRDEGKWRDFFGWRTALGDSDHTQEDTGQPENPEQISPDCVLEFARRVIEASSTRENPEQTQYIAATAVDTATRHALRLIANCCADNESNRRIIMHRDGIKDMLTLAARYVELPTLIPALYNVCIDCEEPSKILSRRSSNATQSSQENLSLSYAAEKLATSCPEVSSYATFELLLDVGQQCSADRIPFLAELIEMAASPSLFGLEHVFGTMHKAKSWNWSSKSTRRMPLDYRSYKADAGRNESEGTTDTIKSAKAVHEQGEQILMCRTILSLLSQEDARISLIRANDHAITRVIELAYIDDADDGDNEEKTRLQKQFLKTFYELTGMPEFVDDHDRASQLAAREAELSVGLGSSSSLKSLQNEKQATNDLLRRACTYVMLSQLASLSHVRDYLLDNDRFLYGLAASLGRDDRLVGPEDTQVVYPAIALVSRLAISLHGAQALATSGMLKNMHHLLTRPGSGLIIPYEAVNAYRVVLKSRPEMLVELTNVRVSDIDSTSLGVGKYGIIGTITTTLYNDTIEAGTKLEIGMFVIDLLRTMFPIAKDMDQLDYGETHGQQEVELKTFRAILTDLGSQLAAILGFVCSKAEPESSRVHGWFGLGMLSIWTDGRIGIANALNTDADFCNTILMTSTAQHKGPAVKNLTLMLSKMQQCSEAAISAQAAGVLKTATANLLSSPAPEAD